MSSNVRKELRNLCRAIEDYHENAIEYVGMTIMDVLGQHLNAAYAALAEPLRDCDAGTPEEQAERFRKFCLDHMEKGGRAFRCHKNCPAKNYINGWGNPYCQLKWAQLPYEEVKNNE